MDQERHAYRIGEICPDYGSYIGDVESNTGHAITPGELRDVLGDFGNFAGVPEGEIDQAISDAVCQYFGGAYPVARRGGAK